MNDRARIAGLLDEMRRIGACDHPTLDAVTNTLRDNEIAILAGQLGKVAAHIATRVGANRGAPPPGTLPGAGTDRIVLSAQWNAVTVAGLFVRNTLTTWLWGDVLFNAELVVQELTKAFVTVIEDQELAYPTRMTLRLRALSAARLVVELHDSPENARFVAAVDDLISEIVEHVSVRCGRHHARGRTVLWSELARPELGRWI